MIIKFNEYAYKRRQIEDRLYESTDKIIEHLIKLYLMPTHESANHWKREIYSFLNKVDKLKGSNKRPTQSQIYTWTFGNKEDTIDNYFVRGMLDTINYDYNENIKINLNKFRTDIIDICKSYFMWLAKELSVKGIITPQQVYIKLERIFNYGKS